MKKTAGFVLLALLAGGLAFWVAGKKSAPERKPARVVEAPAPPAAIPASEKPADTPSLVSEDEDIDHAAADAPPPSPAAAALAEKDARAARLAEADSVESVTQLMQVITDEKDWETRALMSRNLRALGNPEVLQVLLPALLVDYGRGSTVTVEIIDAIGRLAQPDTVTALEALHWQATGGVESMKVVRAMAAIRNPPARRALNKLAQNPQVTESLRLAAQEAAQAITP